MPEKAKISIHIQDKDLDTDALDIKLEDRNGGDFMARLSEMQTCDPERLEEIREGFTAAERITVTLFQYIHTIMSPDK